MGTGPLSQVVKWFVDETDHMPLFFAEVKKEWSCNPILSYAFKVY
jgi:hypothetical protein